MNALLVTAKNKKELKFLSALFKKLDVNFSSLSLEEVEDIGMTILMHDTNRLEKTNRSTILKKLAY